MVRMSLGMVVVALVSAIGTYFVHSRYVAPQFAALETKVKQAEDIAATVKNELIGYTKYTDYLSAGAKQLTGQTKFIAASVQREYDWIREVQRDMKVFSSAGTAAIRYKIDYSFGFDLAAGKFDVTKAGDGIRITVGRPVMVAPPAATLLRWWFPSVGLLTDEKTAALEMFRDVPKHAQRDGELMAAEDSIRALCEKRLIEFFRDFLAKQPGVKAVPNITIAYR